MSTPSLPRQPRRLGPRGRAWFDRLLTLGLVAFTVLGALGADEPAWLVLGLAQTVPLWWRRGHPVLVYTAVAVASAAQVLVLDTPLVSQLAYPVAVYSAARFASARAGAVALLVGLCAAVTAAVDWISPYYDSPYPWAPVISYATTIGVIVLAAWSLGTLGRTRQAYVGALLDHADDLAREAEQRAELAASDERTRIAREMHDVVAHGLSVIIVQADGARYAAAKEPAVAVEALETVSATGREALAEMRRLLGVLRTDDTGVRPQPGLADLPWLLEQAAADGLPLEVTLPDPLPAVGDGVGLVVYRVVQEALTNVRRHAGLVRRVEVEVATAPGGLRVDVRDDGRGAGGAGGRTDGTGGLGLVGMRERVLASGGELEVGPRPGGGFAVGARIPV
ncbi:histidine kinase [Nocardioides zeae]|uniref:histidine kinase n=1 Tax=Nocardioides imazamoxiresistens TaxID=3231893 RepID=A0ABU3PZS6_9ACTN|nr:histidine kinase [Nocardioides zeae]MDT9594730.1 histidine kinase [Nocardioides zeae]